MSDPEKKEEEQEEVIGQDVLDDLDPLLLGC